jgi:hypothetical protein
MMGSVEADYLLTPPPRLLNRRDVNLPHVHHRVEGAFGFGAAGGHGFGDARRDLSRDASSVLAPAAGALRAAVAVDSVPTDA